MKVTDEDLKHLQTWAREIRGLAPHAYRPVENPDPFGDSPICKVCRQSFMLCAHDQGRPDIGRLVIAMIAELRNYRRRGRRA